MCSLLYPVQLQATVLGLLASLMATLLAWMAEGQMSLNHMVLLCSTSLSTAFMASLLQGGNSAQISFLKRRRLQHVQYIYFALAIINTHLE